MSELNIRCLEVTGFTEMSLSHTASVMVSTKIMQNHTVHEAKKKRLLAQTAAALTPYES